MRHVISARFVSSIGDGLIVVAFPLLATSLTRSPVLIAGVAFATTAPWLIFGLAAGALADRVSRRKVLTVVEVTRMIVLLALAVAIITHQLVLAEVYAAAFLVATFETLFDSATMAVIPQLVPEADLVYANSRYQTAQLSGEQFIGPALGGLLFVAAVSLPVIADSASFAVSAVLLTVALRPSRRRGRHGRVRENFALAEPVATRDRPSLVADIKAGLAWLGREPRLRLLAAMIPAFAFCQCLGLGILVVYCTRVLHLGGAGFGVFVAATASGNAIGAWVAPRVHTRLGAGRTLLLAGAAGGLGYLIVGLTSATAVALVAMWVEALAVGVGTVAQISVRQRLVPLELAGRVSAAMRTATLGAAALGTLVGGAMAAVLSVHAPFAIGGAAQIVAAVVIGGAFVRRLAVHDRQVIDLRETIDLTDSPAAAEA
jgi:MFS family permease